MIINLIPLLYRQLYKYEPYCNYVLWHITAILNRDSVDEYLICCRTCISLLYLVSITMDLVDIICWHSRSVTDDTDSGLTSD